MRLVGEEYLGTSSARFRPQGGILRHEDFPPYWVCFEQSFLGLFQHKPQPVQVVEATAPAQRQPEAVLHKPAHHLPVSQIDPRLSRQFLHRRLPVELLLSAQCGGNLPTAQRVTPGGRPLQRHGSNDQWYGDPAPVHQPQPMPSNPGAATIGRAIFPVPGVSALGTFAAAGRLRPFAIVPTTPQSRSCPTPTPLCCRTD